MGMQGQMLGMQSTLERILNVIQGGPSSTAPVASNGMFSNGGIHAPSEHSSSVPPQVNALEFPPFELAAEFHAQSASSMGGQQFFPSSPDVRSNRHPTPMNAPAPHQRREFPPLPGFAPPVRTTVTLFDICSSFRSHLRLTRL